MKVKKITGKRLNYIDEKGEKEMFKVGKNLATVERERERERAIFSEIGFINCAEIKLYKKYIEKINYTQNIIDKRCLKLLSDSLSFL